MFMFMLAFHDPFVSCYDVLPYILAVVDVGKRLCC